MGAMCKQSGEFTSGEWNSVLGMHALSVWLFIHSCFWLNWYASREWLNQTNCLYLFGLIHFFFAAISLFPSGSIDQSPQTNTHLQNSNNNQKEAWIKMWMIINRDIDIWHIPSNYFTWFRYSILYLYMISFDGHVGSVFHFIVSDVFHFEFFFHPIRWWL